MKRNNRALKRLKRKRWRRRHRVIPFRRWLTEDILSKVLDANFGEQLKNYKLTETTDFNPPAVNSIQTLNDVFGEPSYEEGESLLSRSVKQMQHQKDCLAYLSQVNLELGLTSGGKI